VAPEKSLQAVTLAQNGHPTEVGGVIIFRVAQALVRRTSYYGRQGLIANILIRIPALLKYVN